MDLKLVLGDALASTTAVNKCAPPLNPYSIFICVFYLVILVIRSGTKVKGTEISRFSLQCELHQHPIVILCSVNLVQKSGTKVGGPVEKIVVTSYFSTHTEPN